MTPLNGLLIPGFHVWSCSQNAKKKQMKGWMDKCMIAFMNERINKSNKYMTKLMQIINGNGYYPYEH